MRARLAMLTTLAAVAGASVIGGLGVVGAATAADKPACAPGEDQIRAATINVRSNPIMSRDKVVADVDRAAKMGADVLMWQEISPDYYKDVIRAEKIGDPRRGEWRTFQQDLAVPITVRLGGDSPWEFVSEGRKLMHGGRAKVSPNRYISWVVLKDRTSGRKTVFMNTHMVSGAWNGKPDTDDAWRQEVWQKHRGEQAKNIAGFNGQGLSVVYGGDFNRQNVQQFSSRDKQVVNTGIDHLGVVLAAGDDLAAVQAKKTVGGFNSDHDAKLMSITVSGCRAGTATPTTKSPTTKAPTKTSTPKADTTKAPTTKAPTTKTPTAKAPPAKADTTTAPPATQAPTTKAPATTAPATTAPTAKAPTLAPATEAPATPRASQPPASQPPVAQEPATQPTTPTGSGAGQSGMESGVDSSAPASGTTSAPGELDAKTPEHSGGLASTGR